MPRLSFLAALAGATAAFAAESTTVSLLAPLGYGNKVKIVGSVIQAESAKTTYAIGCEPGTPADKCVMGTSSMTIMQGPLTFYQSAHTTVSDWGGEFAGETEATTGTSGAHTAIVDQQLSCSFDPPKNEAYCGGTYTITVNSKTSIAPIQQVFVSYSQLFVPVVITAGVDKLSAAASPTGSQPTATETGTGTGTGTATATATATTGASSSGTPASTTGTKNAGAMATQHVGLVGVAAVLGGGMLLL